MEQLPKFNTQNEDLIAKLSCKPGIMTKYLEKYEIKLFQNMHTYVNQG